MKRTKLALLAALLCAGTAAPALADWDNIGSVDVSFGRDRDQRSFHLGGPIERLQLTADRGDASCRSVRAEFGNGQSADIFHGPLPQGRAVGVDLPGEARNLQSLSFFCGAQNQRGAVIRISADVGRYRDQWRRSPDWQRTWSHMFNRGPANGGGMAYNGGGMGGGMGMRGGMGMGGGMAGNLRMIGSESFEGRNDSENTFAGWQGVKAIAVALKPLETDARCSRVNARFRNGQSQNLRVNNGELLRQGQTYRLDLPGDVRNLTNLYLRCSPADGRRVTIQIFSAR
jgi:hypothetical protein